MFSVLRDALIEWSETYPFLTSGKFQKKIVLEKDFDCETKQSLQYEIANIFE